MHRRLPTQPSVRPQSPIPVRGFRWHSRDHPTWLLPPPLSWRNPTFQVLLIIGSFPPPALRKTKPKITLLRGLNGRAPCVPLYIRLRPASVSSPVKAVRFQGTGGNRDGLAPRQEVTGWLAAGFVEGAGNWYRRWASANWLRQFVSGLPVSW